VLSNIGEFSPNKKTLYDFTPLAGMKSFLFHGAEQVSVRVMPGIGSRSAVNLTGRSPAQHRSAGSFLFSADHIRQSLLLHPMPREGTESIASVTTTSEAVPGKACGLERTRKLDRRDCSHLRPTEITRQ
jgi:hypothetical protein